MDFIPVLMMAFVNMMFTAFAVTTGLESRLYDRFVWPAAERYLDHLKGCGLIYPAVFCYWYLLLDSVI